MKLKNMLLQLN